ncbi:hypothetical protein FOA52_006284 [Chlamydomonas sp. UWO 241]|nr:hypothetical protein FOA52_006284 [Chlamydomonas sp. UWO 241]
MVCMLGADSWLSQKMKALHSIATLCGDEDSMAAIAAAGTIPPLVRLLGAGSVVEQEH